MKDDPKYLTLGSSGPEPYHSYILSPWYEDVLMTKSLLDQADGKAIVVTGDEVRFEVANGTARYAIVGRRAEVVELRLLEAVWRSPTPFRHRNIAA